MQTEETNCVRDLREILGRILDLNAARWRGYILTILKSHADAEDAVQEGVRRLLARNISFITEAQVRQYLARAINNAALELYNSKKRERRKRIPIPEHILLPSNLPGPYECLEERERAARRERLISEVQTALTQMPQKQLEALRLTVMEPGASIRDVGMNHGIPYSTLRHRSRQGLSTLRRKLRIRRKKNGLE
jgi:RNA polymerase sigma factor (sigma-70 family)